ncbi:AraC family transcriptional regulator [Neorhizobium galegae]|uniref:helix-turn-helix domain-containing protein n=1 Tax=Neorhizobium galegae TaxID=399 RepID=UPI002100B44D|nr:AraC family transcriptional regulator [Neorhizobium galegae]MCQ1574644.1 AraC family transcriptional regulator [Neorhizobium galegae]
MQGHGTEKFKDASLIATSVDRPWTGMSAELRSHGAGEIGAFVPQNAEITMIVQGPRPAISTRASGGVKQVVAARPRTTWLCPAGICEEATMLSDEIPEVLHVYLPQHLFSQLNAQGFPDFRAQDLRYQAAVTNPLVLGIMDKIIAELRGESFAGGLRMSALSCQLVAALARDHSETPKSQRDLPRLRGGLDRRRLKRVIDYIEANLFEDISVMELAQVADFSLYHFTRAFRVSTGYTPYSYMGERRIDIAKGLLAYDDIKLTEIAEICRFSNQANFTKAFQRATGHAPGRYRRLWNA